ncbi:protein of unknown function DUF350 [Magnetococcus marinus MC-1]|uniref:DUF350 domain-containing protein n=1 Tax=Magnetococcus marinus (strain ATCC BAA-1437 / JCM 17883 / MC-1) TaxID=156889 RepID=A0LCH0_MAGMM|nr:DUF350 domain-containing protein [Magnetococcus marinus]ABK45663.1 protein of unknown function DUF350 [Magnetococcus marinus MC-1]
MNDWQQGLITIVAFMALYVLVLVVGRFLNDRFTPYSLTHALAVEDNPAIGLSLSGYLLASTLIYLGALLGPSSGSLIKDLEVVGGYSLLGLMFLNLSRWVLDRLLLNQFCNLTAIVKGRNMAMGAVRFGIYLATGFIAAGALHGEGGGPLTASLFFVLGQGVLIVFSRLYDWNTPYALQREIEQGNLAAGIAFAGAIMALGILIGKGISGAFVGWSANLWQFAQVSLVGMVLLMMVRFVVEHLLLPGHDLDEEIARDRNVAAGWVECSGTLGFALLLAVLL